MFSILNSYLDNGLKVLLRRIPNQKTVSCGVWVNQGVKDEDSQNNGISHLTEHLMFKINSKNSKKNMQENMQNLIKLGCKYNAVTTKDYTGYYLDGLNRDLEEMLEVLSYLVVNKEEVKKEDLELEKEIVLREAEGYLSTTKQIGERVGQALWGEHSFGQLVIGKPECIKEVREEQVNELIETAYIPENSVLVVVGGFEFEQAQEYINNFFANWKDKVMNPKSPIIQSKPGIYINDSYGGNRSTVGIGFSTYPCTDVRSKYCEILKDILVRPGSRLFNEIREKRGLVYSLSGFSAAFTNVGNMGLAFTANNEKIKEIIQVCMDEFRMLRKTGVAKENIESIKRIRETELLYSLESTSTQLQAIGKSAIRGKLFLLEDELRELNKVDSKNLTDIINDIVLTDNLSMAVLGSVNFDDILTVLEI